MLLPIKVGKTQSPRCGANDKIVNGVIGSITAKLYPFSRTGDYHVAVVLCFNNHSMTWPPAYSISLHLFGRSTISAGNLNVDMTNIDFCYLYEQESGIISPEVATITESV